MQVTSDKLISDKEQDKLFKAIEKLIETEPRIRVEYTLFKLLALTGLRISEALTLKWTDVLDDSVVIRAVNSKNGKKQSVALGKASRKLLKEFKKLNPYQGKPYVFNTRKGPMKRTTAHDRLKYYLKVARLRDSISCHSFRHGWAVKALDAGISLPMVRDNLRHSNISVTSTYLNFTRDNLKKLREVF